MEALRLRSPALDACTEQPRTEGARAKISRVDSRRQQLIKVLEKQRIIDNRVNPDLKRRGCHQEGCNSEPTNAT